VATKAYILLNVVLGKEKEILAAVKEIEEVQEAYITMGSFDLILMVETADTKDLRPLVSNKIRIIPGVRQSMTVIVV
jgi:DNA-binding Lrp family transcriptional regulator